MVVRLTPRPPLRAPLLEGEVCSVHFPIGKLSRTEILIKEGQDYRGAGRMFEVYFIRGELRYITLRSVGVLVDLNIPLGNLLPLID